MSTLLTNYSVKTNSQFGEDGIIREVLTRIGKLTDGYAIEVGAADGRECSNTLKLRDLWGWRRLLIEGDEERFDRIEEHASDEAVLGFIEPEGPFSIDSLAKGAGVTFLSLDIDGMEYYILDKLQMRPELIVAEFNPTIPLHIGVSSPGLGASLSALIALMEERKSYLFIGATHCNAFFVPVEYSEQFDDIVKDPTEYVDGSSYTYLVSTMYGSVMAFGPKIWGINRAENLPIHLVEPTGEVRTVNVSKRVLP